MNILLEKALQVRYVKLHFILTFPEKCIVPESKASALRGGIGEMLLRANCIRNRDCENCDFQDECMVQRILYSRGEQRPGYVSKGESIGYVIECENYKTEMQAGESLRFNLILFGKSIVYFSQYLTAIDALGKNGLGKYHARYFITKITNTRNQDILSGYDINMTNYQVMLIKDYVKSRKRRFISEGKVTLDFKTPATIKYQKQFIKEFHPEGIILAAQRRLHMLDCYENIGTEEFENYVFEVPELISQKNIPMTTRRYSNRKEEAMFLKGIKGYVEITEPAEDTLDLLLAAEIFHIGKNTHFGYGKMVVK